MTEERRSVFTTSKEPVLCLCALPHGKLASGNTEGLIMVFDWLRGILLTTIEAHSSYVLALCNMPLLFSIVKFIFSYYNRNEVLFERLLKQIKKFIFTKPICKSSVQQDIYLKTHSCLTFNACSVFKRKLNSLRPISIV